MSNSFSHAIPTFHQALALADHITPTPVEAAAALRVLRSRVAGLLGLDVSDLLNLTAGLDRSPKADFAIPMDADDQAKAVSALLYGSDIRVMVGQISLYLDAEAGWVWAVDPYGVDCVASSSCDVDGCWRAIAWAIQEQSPERRHPAEGLPGSWTPSSEFA